MSWPFAQETQLTRRQCYNPPAGMYQGCSLSFQYNNYPYDTQEGQDYCGHQVSYPGFSDIGKAICYFDDGWSG